MALIPWRVIVNNKEIYSNLIFNSAFMSLLDHYVEGSTIDIDYDNKIICMNTHVEDP